MDALSDGQVTSEPKNKNMLNFEKVALGAVQIPEHEAVSEKQTTH